MQTGPMQEEDEPPRQISRSKVISLSIMRTHRHICSGPSADHKKVKVKVAFLYSATYTANNRNQPRFAILEVAVDWQEPNCFEKQTRGSAIAERPARHSVSVEILSY